MRGNHAPAARLRNAIDAYRTEQKGKLDDRALKMLMRLSSSSDAAKAVGRLKLTGRVEEANFLTVCILVEQLARMFPVHILAEQKMPARLRRLDKAIAELRSFVAEQTTTPPTADLLTVWIGGGTPTTVEAMTRGLDLIAKLIGGRRQIADDILARLGATRKMQHKNAPFIAAVRYLAVGVRALTGKPHRREVNDLAPVILGHEVSEESLIYALRARKQQTAQTVWSLILS